MALFKIFRGPEAELNQVPLHEGYAYFCEDTGDLFVDIGVAEGDRRQINAYYATGLYDGSNEVFIDDLMLRDEINEKIDNVSSKTFQATLIASGWVADGDSFTQAISIPELTCGSGGITPPVITYTSNIEEYNYIEEADATIGVGITFTAYRQPTADIDLVIIDVK